MAKGVKPKPPVTLAKVKAVSSELEDELGVTAPDPKQLASIAEQVNRAVELKVKIDGIEEMLKAHKEELHALTTRQLVDALTSAGTKSFTTMSGAKVSLHDFLNGGLPREPSERTMALTWLEANGARDLIKTSFSLALGRGQKALAKQVQAYLTKTGLPYIEKEDVHAQTLYAFARERMKGGEELPLNLLGLYAGQVAKIELPK